MEKKLRLSVEASDALEDMLSDYGVSLTALVEAVGLRLAARRLDEVPEGDQIVSDDAIGRLGAPGAGGPDGPPEAWLIVDIGGPRR